MDTLTQIARTERMGRIRGKDTRPEIAARKLVHELGYRFRLHRRDLPGRPDMTLPRHRVVIFMHGCFWHRHSDPACKLARLPKSRLNFWRPKLDANRGRDRRNEAELARLGWRVLVLWECELGHEERTRAKVRSFLEDGGKP